MNGHSITGRKNRHMEKETQDDARLRPHPETRFAPPRVEIDLNSIVNRLRSEPHTGEAGHRQETLYKSGGLTIALFLFERFTGLPEHRAAGVVNMHVLRGQLKITAEDQVHELRSGQMLVLAPGLKHAVAAEEESEMLVTVRLLDG
jgi:quercetin dioxygenase-like cupin family protein